jgi:hypothetical protein
MGLLMKRSEMLDLLRELIYNNDGSFTGVEVQDLLKEIEKAGMLPPLSKLKSMDRYDNYWEPE